MKGAGSAMTHDYKYPEEWRELEWERILKRVKERLATRRVEWLLDEVVRVRTRINFLGREA
jgi:hypothetical protein